MGADYSAWLRFADEPYYLRPLGIVAGDDAAVVDAGGNGLLASGVVEGGDHSAFEPDEGGCDLGGVGGVANDGPLIIHEDGLGHDSDEARSKDGDAVRDCARNVQGFHDAVAGAHEVVVKTAGGIATYDGPFRVDPSGEGSGAPGYCNGREAAAGIRRRPLPAPYEALGQVETLAA